MSGWAAIGSAVGNIIGSVAAPIIQGEYNKDQSEDSRAWSEDMRQTAYQDTMADMEAAGLNPMLAYSQGPTAITSGATASISAPNGLSNIGSSAVDAYQKMKTVDLTKEQIKKTQAETTKTTADAYLAASQMQKNYKEVARMEWENRLLPQKYASGLEAREMEKFRFAREKEMEKLKYKLTPAADKVGKFLDELLNVGKSVWDETNRDRRGE